MTKKEIAINELWHRGNLKFKCHPVQKQMYDAFYSSTPNSTSVWLLARQSGKSYLLAILALEQALRKPNSVVKLLTDTKVHVKSIFEPIFNMLLEDCPKDIYPTYTKSDYVYTFANKSQIQLAGSDGGHYEKLRGQRSEAAFVDEAGFCTNLEDIVKSVLLPTTTHTGGRIVLASTPPPNPDHDFYKFIEEADLNGALIRKTIHDNPLLTTSQVDRIIKEMGGTNSPKFRREYLVETIREEETVVFPEFTSELEKMIIKEVPKPTFYETYEAMDLGFKDLTVVLFAYYDFRSHKVVIEDEIALKGKDLQLPKLIETIKQKEEALWTHPFSGEVNSPKTRVSDINYIVTQEISRLSNNSINFLITRKDDKRTAVNNTRVKLANGEIIIHPRCTTLIRHLRNCRIDKNKKDYCFARSPDDSHYDAIDALVYLIRNINYNKNPYPVMHGYDYENVHIVNKDILTNNTPVGIYKKIFNLRKK